MEDGSVKKKVKFNARLPFSHLPPYKPAFSERVPVLQAFAIALLNYRRIMFGPAASYKLRIGRSLFPTMFKFEAAECGVYTGSSLIACASLARDAGVAARIVGLDTFQGLPELSELDLLYSPESAPYRSSKLFSDTSLDAVQSAVKVAGLSGVVELRQGLFSKTLPMLKVRRYHFVNVDCDLYEPHLECLEYFYPKMVRGGVIFFDDYHSSNYPMARKAIDVFMRQKPEKLIHLRYGEDGDNKTKAYLVKH